MERIRHMKKTKGDEKPIGIWKRSRTRKQLGPLHISQFRGDIIAYTNAMTVKNSTENLLLCYTGINI
jgi:hypothetical protein